MTLNTKEKIRNNPVFKYLTNSEGFLYKNRYIFLAFITPFLLMVYAFYSNDISPFGSNQVAVIDMYHQYYPFTNELHHKLQNGESLLYSWNGGLGVSFVSLLAYYAASPLLLLTVLVPDAWLMDAITIIIMIKISLGGVFMAIYLQGMFGKNNLSTVIFSTFYALCAYMMGYYWCLMWLDVVFLLPLCMLGLNRLINKGDVKLYTITLAIIMFCNYYIGGMVCIFILFYYPILYFSGEKARGLKTCGVITGKAVLFSIIGICMAGVLLVPTFLNMLNTYYISSEAPDHSSFFNPILSVITNLLPDTQLTVREGLPNIYCGLLCVMLLAFFFLCKKISQKKKLLNCALLAFLILGFNWNKLDYIWHGFHYPNQLPFRYSFVFSFLLVILAYEAFLHIKEITPKQLVGITAGGAFYIILAEMLYDETFVNQFAYVSLFLLFTYAGLLALYRTGKLQTGLFFFLMFLVMFGEMSNHTAFSAHTVGSSNKDEYVSDQKDMRKLVNKVSNQENGFYRMELDKDFTLNAPMLYNFPGASLFSSTANAKVSDFMDRLGLEAQDAKNRYNYQLNTPVANAMLNIKYIIGKGHAIEGEESLRIIKQQGNSYLYENKYPLSIGYMVKDEAAYRWDQDSDNPFNVQQGFVKAATGTKEKLFHMLDQPVVKGGNVNVGPYENGVITCQPENVDLISNLELAFTSDKEQQVYVFVQTEGAESVSLQREEEDELFIREDCPAIRSVGKCKTGDTITIKIQYKEGEAHDATIYAYGWDNKAWEKAYDRLSQETMQVTEVSATKIKGTIQVKKSGHFITSVPYEKGWTVTVDGEKQKFSPFEEAFITVPLQAGTHKIELSYFPGGLVQGILLSFASIAALILMNDVFKRRRKRTNKETSGEVEIQAKASHNDEAIMASRSLYPNESRWPTSLKRRRNI